MRFVICYDIADDGRRTRMHRLLRGYGDAVQESVFEIEASSKRLQALRVRILKLVDPTVDGLRIYTQCQRCEREVDLVCGPPSRKRVDVHVC